MCFDVKTTVYPRIHMFSLDLSLLNGNMRSGSMGCSLLDFPAQIKVRRTGRFDDIIDVKVPELDEQIKRILQLFKCKTLKKQAYRIKIDTPDIFRHHIGLGLSTQVGAGVIQALYKLEKIELNIDTLLDYEIGTKSACGAQLAFDPGFMIEYGYIIDKRGVCLHPDLYHYREIFDKDKMMITDCRWTLIVAIPRNASSISGSLEDVFWQENYPDDIQNTFKIHYYLVQNVLPGLFKNNFQKFISGLDLITRTGTKIKEEEMQSKETKACLDLLRKRFGFAAVSSLGPTIYSFSESEKCRLPRDNQDYSFYKMPLRRMK